MVGNDTDSDGSVDPTTVMLIDPVTQEPTSDPVTIPGEGTYEVDPVTGEVTFTPEDGFVGESTIDYVVADDDGNVSDPATVTVTVQAPLVPPVAVDDDAVTEPGVPVGIDVVGNDSDSDGVIDPTTVMLIDPVTQEPTSDPVTIPGEGTYEVDPVTGEVTFTPEDGFVGESTIDYVVSDDDGNVSDPATVTVTVEAPQAVPVAVDDDAVTEPGVPVGIDVVGNDADSDGVIDPTTVMLIDPVTETPTSGPVVIPGEGTYEVDPVTGEVTFTPEDGFVGESTVDYVVADDDGNVSDPATVTVTVQAAQAVPVAVDDDAVTEPGVPVGIDVVGNDSDSDGVIDPTTVMLIDPVTQEPTSDPVTIPGEGTYEVDPVTGEVTFTPEDGFVGESTVDYVVADDDGNVSDPATITVTVQASPDGPDQPGTTTTTSPAQPADNAGQTPGGLGQAPASPGGQTGTQGTGVDRTGGGTASARRNDDPGFGRGPRADGSPSSLDQPLKPRNR
ncbi:MAG: tandem-95 repeat protein [Acidimicrobiia bacterium]|nr:tandem-95 repeat protein [Acidimicrobiia bacterium]